MKIAKAIISGGGTGGHIFPAISIANALKERFPEVEILFVGADNRMEMERVPAAGYRITGLPVSGFDRKNLWKNIQVITRLVKSLRLAKEIIRGFQPDIVIGVGGYASGPTLWSAASLGIPILIQEQNSYAGITNKLLAKKAAKICVAYEGMEKFFPADKIVLTGNPVRKDLEEATGKKEEALAFFGLAPGKKTLLAVGGSLGAGTINRSIGKHLDAIAEAGIQLIWQTGRYYAGEAQKQIEPYKDTSLVWQDSFITRMDYAYAAADLVISRAGAGTISELCLLGKAAILIPSPNVAEDHQTKNALSLVHKNAAIFISDKEAEQSLVREALQLINNEEALTGLSNHIASLALRRSVHLIVDEIEKTLGFRSASDVSEEELLKLQKLPPTSGEGFVTSQKLPPTSGEGFVRLQKLPPTSGEGFVTSQKLPPTSGEGFVTSQKLPPTPGEGFVTLQKLQPTSGEGFVTLQKLQPTSGEGFVTSQKLQPTSGEGFVTLQKLPPTSGEGFVTLQNAQPTSGEGFAISPILGNSHRSFYFIGAGGIGMSALIRYYLSKGKLVAGYDKTPSDLTAQLIGEGALIHYEDDINLIPETFRSPEHTSVIYTPAVPDSHKELAWFRAHHFEIMKRSQALGGITKVSRGLCVAGTHGKTTTSSMIAHLLKQSRVDCNAFLGGILKNYGSNLLLSAKSDLTVIEADEYDRSFHWLNPYMAVITSADPDHLDIYGTPEAYRESFEHFTSLIRPGGCLIMKEGIPVSPRLQKGVRLFSYSATGGDYYATNTRIGNGAIFFDFVAPDGVIRDIQLGVPVKVNIENAVAAIAIARLNGATEPEVKDAVSSFEGSKRRFDFHIKESNLALIDDYAHHPAELRESILSVKALYAGKKVTGVFQPHLYSRTRDFADDFAASLSLLDELILLDIYPAREEPVPGVTSQIIFDKVTIPQKTLCTQGQLLDVMAKGTYEVVLMLGAGDIDRLVEPVKQLLQK